MSVRSRMIWAEECWMFSFLRFLFTQHLLPHPVLFCFTPSTLPPPPSTFLIFSPMLCTLLQKGFGHELFCWLNIFSPPLTVYPFAPSRFPLYLYPPLPFFLFPAFDPYSQWISKPLPPPNALILCLLLSSPPPSFWSLFRYLPCSVRTVARRQAVLLKLDDVDVLGY